VPVPFDVVMQAAASCKTVLQGAKQGWSYRHASSNGAGALALFIRLCAAKQLC
jgi:hypothetical protein